MNILVVAAHPDDEVLGVGGTIARHVDFGESVTTLIMATGATSRSELVNEDNIKKLKKCALDAAKKLGVDDVRFVGLPDNRMDSIDFLDVVKHVEAVIKEIEPEIIYTHFPNDLNIDHRLTAQAVLTATRPLPESTVKKVYAFETLSSTEWQINSTEIFKPTSYIDISSTLEKKMKALSCYEVEMTPFPHARSMEGVEALAKTRGCHSGVEAAEAFMLLREVMK